MLLASDYDDTLYGYDLTISRENRDAIDYFTREGGRFTVATGRALSNFTIQMETEQVPVNAPVILSNGSQLYDFSTQTMVYQSFLQPETPRDLAEVAKRFPAIGFEAYCGDQVYLYNPNAVTWRHLTRACMEGVILPIGEMPLPWAKVILQQDDTELLSRVQAFMQETWPDRYEVIFSNPVLLEMTAKNTHKGSAVLRVAELLGIEREHIYCIGDNQNDLPMLEISAIPFAPANCSKAVKDWGAVILRTCDESCVAQLIGILNQRYGGRRAENPLMPSDRKK